MDFNAIGPTLRDEAHRAWAAEKIMGRSMHKTIEDVIKDADKLANFVKNGKETPDGGPAAGS